MITKQIPCKCKCKFDGRKFNSNQERNNDKCRCECKNPKKQYVCKKNDIWNPATCSCENGRIKKNCYNKANFNKFINFTSPFNNYHSIIGSC